MIVTRALLEDSFLRKDGTNCQNKQVCVKISKLAAVGREEGHCFLCLVALALHGTHFVIDPAAFVTSELGAL